MAQKLHFSTAKKSKATAEDVLVVEDSEDSDVEITEPSSKKTKWVQSLSGNDRAILLSPVAWLNDNVVTAAQILLKSQTSCGGLQQPTLGQSLGFDIMREEFVQVLHDGHSHWLTVSNIGASNKNEIFVYDSLYCSLGSHTKNQIAALLCFQDTEIAVKFVDVQKQSGTYDCGLFVVAFATCLAIGVQPGSFTFKQQEMRRHLYKCLDNGKMQMFPVLKTRSGCSSVKSNDTIDIYCTCRMPDTFGNM